MAGSLIVTSYGCRNSQGSGGPVVCGAVASAVLSSFMPLHLHRHAVSFSFCKLLSHSVVLTPAPSLKMPGSCCGRAALASGAGEIHFDRGRLTVRSRRLEMHACVELASGWEMHVGRAQHAIDGVACPCGCACSLLTWSMQVKHVDAARAESLDIVHAWLVH